eukprot:1977044-Prymnesium_polylepis.1
MAGTRGHVEFRLDPLRAGTHRHRILGELWTPILVATACIPKLVSRITQKRFKNASKCSEISHQNAQKRLKCLETAQNRLFSPNS